MIDLFSDAAMAWQEAGACATARLDPEIFLSEDPRHVATAITVCTECPVVAECRQFAIAGGETSGVWGGVDFTASA